MSHINWLDLLGWSEEELEDLRFVGFSYVKQGKYDIALKFFEALSVLSPENEYDLQTIGALYLQTGDNLAALNYLERALRINPTHTTTLLNRAKAFFLLGYKRQGVQQANELKKSEDPDIVSNAEALLTSYA